MAIDNPMFFAAQSNANELPSDLKHGLRALAVAGQEFEPFVERMVSPDVICELIEMGLAERGDSGRPSVGSTGYRLTDTGWKAVKPVWGFDRRR